MARWAAGSAEEGRAEDELRVNGDEATKAVALLLLPSLEMMVRARRVPRAAHAVGRARRAAGGTEDIGPAPEAAVVLIPHLRLMLPRRLADVAEQQEPHWTNLVVVEELGVSSPLISMAIWAPYDSLCFCRWPPSIFCCALYFLSRSHDTGGDADEAEEDYEEELRASIRLYRRPPSPPSLAIDAKQEREGERREAGGMGLGRDWCEERDDMWA
uniref:Uncharacterized protein n=1 Tax=Oryza rufipogon TaxID=4529 RepID=A0A0E0QZ25_ORYRU